MTTLVTVGGERDYPGHVPSEPVARHLVAGLIAAGRPVRVLAPPEHAHGWPQGAEVIEGDVARPTQVGAPFAGVDRLLLAGAEPETIHDLVTSACGSGVGRIVLLSSHGPEVEVAFPPDAWYWLAMEVVVERSGARWTHVQPSPLMVQTLEPGFPDTGSDLAAAVRSGAAVRERHLDEPYPLIDEADLAAVARAALDDDRYAGRTLAVHGEPIGLRDQLRLIGQALGREVPVEALTPEQAAERYRQHGLSDDEIDALAVDDEPDPDAPDPEDDRWMAQGVQTLAQVLGRLPRTYAEWLADHTDLLR